MEENLPKFENREELVVNSDVAIDLRKAMSWAKFLSIMMFIGTGMMFLLSIVCFAVDPSTWFDNDMEPGAGGILGGVYLAVTVIYFFLSYFMYMFSVEIKRAIADGDKAAFGSGIRNMKYYFQLGGILTIVALGLVVLLIILGLIGMAAFLSM